MALILLSGFPCCGKTTFANILKDEIIKRNDKQKVVIVNEEMLHIEKLSGYKDSTHEKFSRGLLKAAVDREVSVTDTIVISDSLNYIKGYRYELYCIARALRLITCCVYVECPDAVSDNWNAIRREREGVDQTDSYTDEIMKQLRMRYEFPNDKNRWENPLFHVKMGEMDPTADAPPSISTPVSQAAADSSPDGVPQTVFEKVSDATAKPVAPKKSSWKPKGSKKIAETVATTAVAVATMHVDPKGSGETGVWFSGSHVKQPVFTSSGESGDSGALQDFSPAAVCQRVLNFIYSSSVTGGATGSTSGNKGNLPASVHPSPAGQMPNASTMSMPHVQANILYELDRVSALVTNKIIAHVKQHPADSAFTITDVVPPLLLPEYDRVFNIHKQITVAELHRHRRQFVKVNTLCPPVIHTTDGLSDNDSLCASLGCLYIDFLSAQL